MSDRFEVLAHTADKGIRAFGSDLKELFENAAYGMFSLVADLERYTPTETREVEAEAEDRESLLKTWLAELLFQFEVDRILFVDFEIKELTDTRLKALARGLPFGAGIEWLGSAVKAVTYEDLCIRRRNDRWEAQVILDV